MNEAWGGIPHPVVAEGRIELICPPHFVTKHSKTN